MCQEEFYSRSLSNALCWTTACAASERSTLIFACGRLTTRRKNSPRSGGSKDPALVSVYLVSEFLRCVEPGVVRCTDSEAASKAGFFVAVGPGSVSAHPAVCY